MYFSSNVQTITRSGVATRCIEENKNSVIKADTKANSLTIAKGEILSYRMLNGIILHGGHTKELQDYQIVTTLSKSMIIVILLEGELKFNYDDLDIHLNSVDEQAGIVVNFSKPVCFGRKFKLGNEVTKLNILIPSAWLKSFTATDEDSLYLIEKHLASWPLTITEAMQDRAKEILQLGAGDKFMDKMKIESHTQLLLIEIFQQLSSRQGKSKESLHTNNKDPIDPAVDTLIKYIELNIDENISTEYLSEIAVMSVQSLQRRFKKSLGFSIQSYIRRRRLDIARKKLEHGLIGITEAAYSCGYRYPSNFTNAYKKTFGYPPLMTTKK